MQESPAFNNAWHPLCSISMASTKWFRFQRSHLVGGTLRFQKPAKRLGWRISASAIWAFLANPKEGISMSILGSIRSLSLKNSYRQEYSARLNSYYTCLLNWTNNKTEQRETELALASIRLDEIQKGWSIPYFWMSLMTTAGNFLTRPREQARTANVTDRSCVAGLSRSVVTAPPRVAPKVDLDRTIARQERIEALPSMVPVTPVQGTCLYAASNMFRK
jgi:hypothetical protein